MNPRQLVDELDVLLRRQDEIYKALADLSPSVLADVASRAAEGRSLPRRPSLIEGHVLGHLFRAEAEARISRSLPVSAWFRPYEDEDDRSQRLLWSASVDVSDARALIFGDDHERNIEITDPLQGHDMETLVEFSVVLRLPEAKELVRLRAEDQLTAENPLLRSAMTAADHWGDLLVQSFELINVPERLVLTPRALHTMNLKADLTMRAP